MHKKSLVAAILGVLVLALAVTGISSAKVGQGKHHKFDVTFTSKSGKAVKKVKTGVGVKLLSDRADYVAPGPGQVANPVTDITWKLPAGTKVNTKAIPSKKTKPCTEAKLGNAGDPKAAGCVNIGKGDAEAFTGIKGIDPVLENLTVYAGPNVLIGRLTPKGAIGQTANIYIQVKGTKLVVGVPKFCLPGDQVNTPECDNGEAVLTKVTASIKAKSSGKGKKKKNLLTTPAKCGKSKQWTSKGTYKFRIPETENVTSKAPCKPAKKKKKG